VWFASGASAVKVTYSPAQVAACSSVGNIQVAMEEKGGVDQLNALSDLKEQAANLGGNTALMTGGPPARRLQVLRTHAAAERAASVRRAAPQLARMNVGKGNTGESAHVELGRALLQELRHVRRPCHET
jgi:hypothetical protein